MNIYIEDISHFILQKPMKIYSSPSI